MQIVEIAINEIKPYEHNPRKNDASVAAVAESIRQFGFKVPIVIDRSGTIVAGHTRYKAAKKLGLKAVPCLVADDLTDAQIQAFRLADNKVGELSEWDYDLLNLELSGLDNLGIDMSVFGFNDMEYEQPDEQDEYERKSREFQERMEAGELAEDSEEYQEFLQKFEAKKTTDDCYTPPNIYEAVSDYVAEHYELHKKDFVRPFYPGGDYQKEKYKPTDIVVDNPPFSIISEICRWYQKNNIKFFLFAPHLTCMGIRAAQKIATGVSVTYENGANVNTSFVTNMDEYEFRSAPDLYASIKAENDKNLAAARKELPIYDYPLEVVRQTDISMFSKYGVNFAVRPESCYRIAELDEQKAFKKGIFGSGYLISEKAAAEKAAAEKAAAQKWRLSDREMQIVKSLK